MQALKYSLRLMLCRPVLAMLSGIIVIFIALSMIASVFIASLTWQAALWAGAKFGGIFAAALWAMFFIKTFMAVSAGSDGMPVARKADGASSRTGEEAPSQIAESKSTPDKPSE